ncbi:MAG: SpoVA/SpoVAEb family sporulation membrane protein [Clostridiales bacterium]|nr:MAG: SpoVA/SpoVAEb family sporulation membrane protein [Clostridiales bacterium]
MHENAPKTKQLKTLIPAFLVGGAICSIGQLVSDLLKMWTSLDKDGIGAATSVILIFLGSLFTGLGLYDRLGRIAGGGSIVPITGFANSIVSPAMEFNQEGVIFRNLRKKMFVISGPIIVLGVSASVVVGLIYMIFMKKGKNKA